MDWAVNAEVSSRSTSVTILVSNVTQLSAHAEDVARVAADCNLLQEVRATSEEADRLSKRVRL